MAAFFVFEDNTPRMSMGSSREENHGLEWHIGSPLPEPPKRHGYPTPRVLEVQADGDELDYILNCFNNIPGPTSLARGASWHPRPIRVVCWFGDTAMFIYHNLR